MNIRFKMYVHLIDIVNSIAIEAFHTSSTSTTSLFYALSIDSVLVVDIIVVSEHETRSTNNIIFCAYHIYIICTLFLSIDYYTTR